MNSLFVCQSSVYISVRGDVLGLGCGVRGTQRIDPVVMIHCNGHSTITATSTMITINSSSFFQLASLSIRLTLGRV